MPTNSNNETISAHDEGEDLPRMGGSEREAADLIAELDEAAGRITQYSNSPLDGLLNAAARMIEALSAAPQSDGWISVDERLPAHEQEVICTGFTDNDPTKKRWQDFAWFHKDGAFYDQDLGEELHPPTHWREMFALPTTQTQGPSHGE